MGEGNATKQPAKLQSQRGHERKPVARDPWKILFPPFSGQFTFTGTTAAEANTGKHIGRALRADVVANKTYLSTFVNRSDRNGASYRGFTILPGGHRDFPARS